MDMLGATTPALDEPISDVCEDEDAQRTNLFLGMESAGPATLPGEASDDAARPGLAVQKAPHRHANGSSSSSSSSSSSNSNSNSGNIGRRSTDRPRANKRRRVGKALQLVLLRKYVACAKELNHLPDRPTTERLLRDGYDAFYFQGGNLEEPQLDYSAFLKLVRNRRGEVMRQRREHVSGDSSEQGSRQPVKDQAEICQLVDELEYVRQGHAAMAAYIVEDGHEELSTALTRNNSTSSSGTAASATDASLAEILTAGSDPSTASVSTASGAGDDGAQGNESLDEDRSTSMTADGDTAVDTMLPNIEHGITALPSGGMRGTGADARVGPGRGPRPGATADNACARLPHPHPSSTFVDGEEHVLVSRRKLELILRFAQETLQTQKKLHDQVAGLEQRLLGNDTLLHDHHDHNHQHHHADHEHHAHSDLAECSERHHGEANNDGQRH